MNTTAEVLLGLIAVATLVMAAVQVGLVIVASLNVNRPAESLAMSTPA